MDQFNSHPLFRRHNIDSAMSSLWDFYKKRFLMLFAVSFVMSLIIQYASTMVDLKELQTITDPLVMLEKIKEYILPILILSLISLIFAAILQHYIIYHPVDEENNIYTSVARTLKYIIPYIIILILLTFAGSIAIVLGILALVIGVFFSILYIMTLYLFILPVMMVEETNISDTISRTLTLAHRNFWTNIGWVAVFIIILIVISVILSSIILLPFTGSFLKTIVNPEEASSLIDFTKNPLFIILSAIINALTLPLMPIFACILYFNGKAGEEQTQTIKPEDDVNERVRVEDLYAKPYHDDTSDDQVKND